MLSLQTSALLILAYNTINILSGKMLFLSTVEVLVPVWWSRVA